MRSNDLFWPHQWQFLLLKCTLEVNFFLFCILVPWYKVEATLEPEEVSQLPLHGTFDFEKSPFPCFSPQNVEFSGTSAWKC